MTHITATPITTMSRRWRSLSPTGVNLCFHGIGTPARELEPGEARYWVSPAVFEGVLDLVAERSDVALSFDDGNASDVLVALPHLVRRGLTATFFPLAGRLHGRGSLDADGLRELVGHGMDLGSHGWTHRPFPGMESPALRTELVHARRELALAAGVPVSTLALPLGRYDRSVLHAARRLAYTTVYSSDRAHARADAWLQPRYSVTSADTVAKVRQLLDRPPSLPSVLISTAKIAVKRLR